MSTTTGTDSVAIGRSASYAPNGTAANATTTAVNQTVVGAEAGQGSATQVNGITAVGRRATVTGTSGTAVGTTASAVGAYSVALGAATVAGHAGGSAIGADNTGAAAATAAVNEIALGTALHTVKVLGRVNTAVGTTAKAGINIPHGAAPTTPVDGDVWSTTAGLFIQINGETKTVTFT